MRSGTARAPASAWTIGAVSLLPFYVASGLYCFGPEPHRDEALLALMGWSAAMLSYLGGVRAGVEIDSHVRPRWWTVVPAILSPVVGFVLLFGAFRGLLNPVQQVSGFMIAFVLVWLWDQRTDDGPSWRPRFRTWITTGAIIALAFAVEQAMRM